VNKQSPGSEDAGEEAVEGLLNQLSSGRANLAWADFLKRYSALFMQVARQFADDAERSSDCFLVAQATSDDGFRRLRSYRPGGTARPAAGVRLTAWLVHESSWSGFQNRTSLAVPARPCWMPLMPR
jgi:hypothetical protein